MLYQSLLILHIVSGFLALILGAMAAVSRKGAKYHLRSGRWYVYCMYSVGFTSIIMTQLKPNTFLFTVGVFTLYLTHMGQRAIYYYRLKNDHKINWQDLTPIVIALLMAIYMIAKPIMVMLKSGSLQVVMLVFGAILFGFALRDLINCLKNRVFISGDKTWLIKHIGLIGGAYIATLTAFLVTNITLEPSWVVWLLPTVVGTILITKSSNEWRKKLKLSK